MKPEPQTYDPLKLLTRRETADCLRVSVQLLDELCGSGQIAYVQYGRRRFFRRRQIEAFEEKYSVEEKA